jgi:PAS domain S-box-containing protein
MKAIVESSHDAIIGMTLEGIITSWNPAAERMYGYSSEEIVGSSIDRLIPEGQMAEMAACMAKVSAGEHVERVETIRVRKDGTVQHVTQRRGDRGIRLGYLLQCGRVEVADVHAIPGGHNPSSTLAHYWASRHECGSI